MVFGVDLDGFGVDFCSFGVDPGGLGVDFVVWCVDLDGFGVDGFSVLGLMGLECRFRFRVES